MLTRACLSLSLLVALPAWSQVVPAATGSTDIQDDVYRMPIPPMVSGQAFPATTLSETRSNYLDAGLTLQPAYDDNLAPNYGGHPISDMGYSISPAIELDQLTPRLHQTWTYRPGFTIYQRMSARNEADQNASLNLQYRLSPHITVSGQDTFLKSSNVFNQPYSALDGAVSGLPPSLTADVIVPFADQLSNAANAELTYQFSRDGMIGAGGTSSLSNYLSQAQSTGLYDSNSRGGSAFYNRRLTAAQYLGVTYQYLRIKSNPENEQLEIQTHTLYAFYTAILAQRFSLSLAVGPQHVGMVLSPLPASASWTPAAVASISRQGERTNIAASYSRSVTGGGGLLGAFTTNSAGASAHWQLARTWDVQAAAAYAIYKNVSALPLSSEQGGHSISGTVSVGHSFSGHLSAQAGYQRLHQSYNGIAAITSDPDSDREYISISYQFTRPLGR